ncbi:MAG: hypothetical protein PF447_07215 [Spirochaetaceae bacterium]|jgi:hypothetical protein|nr:hypothetical protein [Spirochaetaceae bacterium]
MKKIFIVTTVLLLIFSCASSPEGFEDSKQAAAQAQLRAQDMGAPEELPIRYGEAQSSYELAQEKEASGDLEGAMDMYQRAEVNFNVAAAETEKKQRVDNYMSELNPLLEELEQLIAE